MKKTALLLSLILLISLFITSCGNKPASSGVPSSVSLMQNEASSSSATPDTSSVSSLTLNTKILGIAGITNGELKQINGADIFSSELIGGGTPVINYTSTNAIYAFNFALDVQENWDAALAGYQSSTESYTNKYSDEFIVSEVILGKDDAKALFDVEKPSYTDICTLFNQSPSLNENPGPPAFFDATYTFEGYSINVSFTSSGSTYIFLSASITVGDNQPLWKKGFD